MFSEDILFSNKEEVLNKISIKLEESKRILIQYLDEEDKKENVNKIFENLKEIIENIKTNKIEKMFTIGSPNPFTYQNDVKIICSDEEEFGGSKDLVFSYLSSDNYDSDNKYKIGTNFNSPIQKSKIIYSKISSPFLSKALINSPNKLKNDFERKFYEDLFSNQLKISHKWFIQNCMNCNIELKIRKIEIFCCDNFICKKCVMTYFNFLSELILNFNIKKFTQDKCLSKTFNLFYCNFCYIIDSQEKLEQCRSHLCNNYYHRDCYELVKLFCEKKIPNFTQKSKQKILQEIMKESFYNKKSRSEKDNKTFLMNNLDNGKTLAILYKMNTCSFYKLFIKHFKEYISMIFRRDFNEKFDENNIEEDYSYCQIHLCLVCGGEVDELLIKIKDNNNSFNIIEENKIKICCNNYHHECHNNGEKDHIELNLQNVMSHIPILHLKNVRETYDYMKKESKKEVSLNVINQNDENKNDDNKDKKIDKFYSFLSNDDKKRISSLYIEISQNVYPKNYISNKKENNFYIKCDCINEMINSFNNHKNNKKIANFFKDSKFREFLKSKGNCCLDSCPNRSLKIECFNKTCDCLDEYCKNRYSNNRSELYNHLEIIKTSNTGNGLICKKIIQKGQFIIEYIGEIIDFATATERINEESDQGWYLMSLDGNSIIDACKMGNKSRFINHSCQPNCIVEKWIGLNGLPKLFLFAKENIKAGTELTYDYKFNYFENGFKQECNCNSENCGKIMGSKKNVKKEISYDFVEIDKIIFKNYKGELSQSFINEFNLNYILN